MSLVQELTDLLESAASERPILAWLKRNPLVLSHTLPFTRYVAAEFPFGTDYRATECAVVHEKRRACTQARRCRRASRLVAPLHRRKPPVRAERFVEVYATARANL